MQAHLKLLLFCSLILVGLQSAAQIPSNGLIGAWPFSGNANDLSISANNGTLVAATPTLDRCGNANSAYYFNGSSSLIRTSQNGPTGSSSRSLSFWAKTTNTVINSPRSSFHYGTSAGNSDSWQVVWNYCSQGIGLDLSNQALIRGNICLENNAWHHIALVFDNTISTVYSTVSFYIDGVLQNVIVCNVSGTNANINTIAGAPITFGKDANFNNRYFEGSLDDFYLYNRALTTAEVLQLYNVTPCLLPVFGNTLVCPGSTNVYSVAPYTNATYTWSLPGGWTGTSTTNTISTVAGSTGGNILVTASSSCGILPSFSVAVTIGAVPTHSISSSSATICSYQSASLSVSGATSYTWSTSASNTAIVVAPGTTSVYTAVTQNSAGCNATATFTQFVTPDPTISVAASTIACFGGSSTLTASGASSYTWLPSNSTATSIVVTPTSSALSYTTLGTALGCTSSVTGTLSPPSSVSLAIVSSSTSACLGTSITFTGNATGGTGPYSYTWNPSATTGSVASFANPTAGNLTTTLTVRDANNCSITAVRTVSFFQGAAIAAPTADLCPNSNGTLSASGASTYTWQPGAVASNTLLVNSGGPSTYTVVGTTAAGCTAAAVASITIRPTPSLSFNTFTITCGNLGSATVTPSGGIGPFSYTWTPTLQTGSVASSLFPGVYTVTVRDNGTSCVITPTTNFLPLVPMTGTVSSSASNPCFGVPNGTAAISLSGGSGSQSYLWLSANGTQTNSIASNLAAGINTVSVTDALTFCNVTHTFFIAQPAQFTVTISNSSPSVCLGGAITLSATVSGGTPSYSLTWYNTQSTATTQIQEALAGSYTYSINVLDANTCTTTKTTSVVFVPNPVVVVNSPTVCPLEPFVLTASGASSYTWDTGSQLNPLPLQATTSINYVVVGSALGCTNSASAFVTVKPTPVASFITNSLICQNGPLTLQASGGGTYLWSGPSAFSSTAATLQFTAASLAQSGLYTLKVTAANNCTASITQSVTVNVTPPLVVAGSTVCEGSSLYLGSNFLPGATYQWTGAATSATTQNVNIPASTTSMTGTYTLVLTAATGCTRTAVANCSVATQVTANITGSVAACVGKTITLQGTGGQLFSWSGPANFFSASSSVSIVATSTNQSGMYTFVTSNGPCQQSSTVVVTVYALPSLIATVNTPICENTSTQFTASGANVYSWSGPAAVQMSGANPILSPISLSSSGLYTLTGTDNNGCIASSTTSLHVLSAPALIVPNYTACIGSPLTISASGGVTYTWTGPGINSITSNSFILSAINATNQGTYQVQTTGTNNCKSTVNIQVQGLTLPLPTALITGLGRICKNNSTLLIGTGGTSYQWYGPKSTLAANDSLYIFASDSSVSGLYTLQVTGANSCVTSRTIQVNYLKLPEFSLSVPLQTKCAPFCSTIKVSETKNTGSLKSIQVLVNKQKIEGTNFKYCFEKTGLYKIEASVSDSFDCVNSSALTLEAYEKPVADFTFTPTFPVAGQDLVNFYNTSTGQAQTTWQWYLSGKDSLWNSGQTQNYLYEQSGQVPIVMIVGNKWGCSDTIIKTIVIDDEFNVFVPNSFTPNGDRLNDIFIAKGTGVNKFKLEVFNRWGQIIFDSQDINEGWDGTYKSEICELGAYTWKITASLFNGKQKIMTGNVNLLR